MAAVGRAVMVHGGFGVGLRSNERRLTDGYGLGEGFDSV